jgi:hypothetical protein
MRFLPLWLATLLVAPVFAQERSASTPPPPRPGRGMPGFPSLGGVSLLPVSTPTVSYGGWLAPRNAPEEISQQRLTLQFPVHRGGRDSVSLGIGGNSLHFSGPQSLAGSGIAVPMDLWKIEASGSWSRRFSRGRLASARVSIGSASDRPFTDVGVTTFGATAFWSWEESERSRWFLTLFFSNNSPLINWVPIPGFIYFYATEGFIGLFGVPFTSATWMPVRPWSVTAGVFGPTLTTEIAYGDLRGTNVFAGWSFQQQSYIPSSRAEDDDRVFLVEKRAPVGVRFTIGDSIKSELSGGYAYDRSVRQGTRMGKKERGTLDLGNSWFVGWNLRAEIN